MESLNQKSQSHQSAPSMSVGESLEFNLIEFVTFVYSRRRLAAIMSVALFIALIVYILAVQRAHYRAASTINVNISSKAESFSMARYNTWIEEQETTTKIFSTEQFFDSSQFRRAVIASIAQEKECENELCSQMRAAIRGAMDLRQLKSDEEKMEFVFSRLAIHSDTTHFILTIMGTDRDPKVAHALATIAAETLVAMNFKSLLSKNSRVRSFLENQTKITSDGLAELEKTLVEEQKKHNLIGTTETETRLTAIHIEQQQRLHTLTRDKLSIDLLEHEILEEIKTYKVELSSSKSVSFLYLSQLQKRFDLLKYQMAVESASDRNPASGDSPAQIANKAEFAQYGKILESGKASWVATDIWDHIKKAETLLIDIRQQREKIVSEIYATQKSNAEWNTNFVDLPDVLRRLTELKRNIQIATEVYASLKTRLQEINIRDAAQSNDLAVLALPEIPTEPMGLSLGKKIVVAIMASPGLSILLLLLAYILIPLIRSAREIEALGVSVLGSITQFRGKGSLLKMMGHPQVFAAGPQSYQANSLRYIRFRLEQELSESSTGERGNVVAVTSFNTREGKTFLSVNLATAYAMSGIRVLLIDLDMKASDMTFYFGEPIEVKEIETSNRELDFKLSIHSANIHILSVKNKVSDVCDFMQSHEFKNILDQLRESYEYIFFDTAPIDGSVEAYLATALADATIFVINHRSTLKSQVSRGLSSLRGTTGGKLLAVLNFSHDDLKAFRWKKRIA